MDAPTRVLCESLFWDWDSFWNTSTPRVTNCFRHLVLILLPCLFLWLACFFKIIWNRGREATKSAPSPWTVLAVCKLALSCVLILSTAAEGILLLSSKSLLIRPVPRVNYISVSVRLGTFVLALFLQLQQRRQGKLNSYILATFWSLYAICDALGSPLLYVVMMDLGEWVDPNLFILETISYSMILAEAVLSFFTDPHYSYFWDPKIDDYVIEHQPIFSRLLFWWINRTVCYGYRNTLDVKDLDLLDPKMRTANMHKRFHASWITEDAKAKTSLNSSQPSKVLTACRRGPSLLKAITKALWPWLLAAGILELAFDFVSLMPPIILDWLLSFMDNNEPSWHGYVYAILLFVTAALSTLLILHNQNFLIYASIIPRSGLGAAIYRKVLRLTNGSRRNYSLGELCNLVSVDIQRIVELVWSVNSVWSCPLRMALIITLLWQYLGIACLAGISVMLLIMPITGKLASITHKLQKAQMQCKDLRLRQMNEILNGIKVLKLYAWEYPFMEEIGVIRKGEAVLIKKLAFVNGCVLFLWLSAPFLIAISSFVAFVLIDEKNRLDPSIAFVSLTLFNKLRSTTSTIPQVVAELIQSRIAFRRITSYLLAQEFKQDVVVGDTAVGNSVEIDGSFSWANEEPPFLCDVTLSVGRGSLTAVVGRVGSGKSALFSVILGEMHSTGGAVRIRKGNRLAYVPQQAWIQNSTVRQNILFVRQMEKKRYNDALDRCCLRPDHKDLPGGDLTEIGEKGVNLSGGQKQRVSLARAIYQDADIYLLDDPLSAVDAHVGAKIFKNVLGPQGILKNKTRILVTHDLSILHEADAIILMSDGKVVESGTYKDLLEQKGEFARLIEEHCREQMDSDSDNDKDRKNSPCDVLESESSDPTKLTAEELKKQMKKAGRRLSRTLSRSLSVEERKSKQVRFIEREKIEVGRVKAGVFWSYFRKATLPLIFLVVFGFSLFQGFEIGSNVWLSLWSNDQLLADGSQDTQLRNLRIGVYGALGLAGGLCILLATFVLAAAATKASIRLHQDMLWSIMRSPMFFFDTTPLGRILNRFGKDINTVDTSIPAKFNSSITVILAIIGSLVVISANFPLFLLSMVPLTIVYIFIQFFYMATSRQLRRLQATTLSPVLSCFSETAQGTSTIKAFGAQFHYIDKQERLIDDNCRVFLNYTFVNRWLAIRLQFLGAAIVFIVALLSVLERNVLAAAVVGLMLSYALNVTDNLTQMVRILTQLENCMVSVERINEYSELPPEASWKTDSCLLSLDEWPRHGAVSFREYKMRYRPGTDLVLKGITAEITPGEKVGVVGRTGVGKSSLALALLRIVEADSGRILIDGIDIGMLGLHDLRSKITVIPQEPVVFSGSLRMNLDPLQQHTDKDLWTALEHAHLKNFVKALHNGLGYQVSERGENLSVGQRQQICLARALLKKTKILVLDEATASVDLETDKLIQATIRKEFRNSTVITIAHRLHTVLDYDRILVMDDGRIVEDGDPDKLLQKQDSLFYELGKAAGLL
ncbi:multidrug resistance-associated protein 1-like isoform X2 [Stegodyphus dumicola]|uniref:multidrug resistance-associated protein 1-like isoform X2 n=1 Tax=Stegodyphus dumicola TaxID=202533 RepID=UPI0015B1F835|nr:multidrug resistance-associated protein 1-like isoform X2 [Stegodyphus dumicola]